MFRAALLSVRLILRLSSSALVLIAPAALMCSFFGAGSFLSGLFSMLVFGIDALLDQMLVKLPCPLLGP